VVDANFVSNGFARFSACGFDTDDRLFNAPEFRA
jgi:hypothetical protein